MFFIIFLILGICNILIFGIMIEVENESSIIEKAYEYITYPMLIYSVVYLIYIYTRQTGIYTLVLYKSVMTVILGLVIINNIVKIIFMYKEHLKNSTFETTIGIIFMLISLSNIVLSSVFFICNTETVISEKYVLVETTNLEKIELTGLIDESVNIRVATIINKDNKESQIDLEKYTLLEMNEENNDKEKYISKYMVKTYYENLLEQKSEDISYDNIIYTSDLNEYLSLYELYEQDVIKNYYEEVPYK